MHWRNLDQNTCLLIFSILGSFFLWRRRRNQLNQIFRESGVYLPTPAWWNRWNILWLLCDHRRLMFKLLFIFIKCKWDYRLRHHRLFLLKTLDLSLHLLQSTFYFLNFFYCFSIKSIRRRQDVFLFYLCNLLWCFYGWFVHNLIFFFSFQDLLILNLCF